MTRAPRAEPADDILVTVVCAVCGVLIAGGGSLYTATWLAASMTKRSRSHPSVAEAGRFIGAMVHGRAPWAAWTSIGHSQAPAPLVVCSIVAAGLAAVTCAFVLARRLVRRPSRPDEARWATRRDEKRIVVVADPAGRPFRLLAGRSRASRRLVAGEDCVSAVAFGPNGSGKTVGLIIPNALEWRGSVVMTTAKPQDVVPVLSARAAVGPTYVIAPGGAPGTHRSSWSPVDYAVDADAADRMAGWLVESSGMTDDVRARPWNAQARKYLKGLLYAAQLSGRGLEGFVEWAYDGEVASAEVCEILTRHGELHVLREYRSTWRIHEEGKGSVMFTAFGLADTYNRPGIMAAAKRSDFTSADLFGNRPATLFLVTPQSEVERFTPYFTALIASIVHEAEQRAAAAGGPVEPRLLLALDEAGNVFRYPRLPHLLTTARGNGVQLLLAYHDIAQIEHLFGGRDVARTILSNAKLRMLLPGVADLETLRYFSDLLGHAKVTDRSRQTGPDGRRSTSEADRRELLAPVQLLQQLPDGEAVMLYENLPPVRVRLRRWFEDRALSRLVGSGVARTGPAQVDP